MITSFVSSMPPPLRFPERLRALIRAGTSVLVVGAAWEALARSGVVPPALFPPPSRVALALAEYARSGELVRDVGASFWRVVAGCLLGSFVGVVTGLATGRWRRLDAYLSPLIQLLRPLPPVAIVPLIIIWFGIGDAAKLFSIAFAVFFPVWVGAYVGARTVPQIYLWSAQILGVRGWVALARVVFPAALPTLSAGLRTGVGVAFVMAFVAELAGASSGVGYQIAVSHLAYRIDRMMAALAVLAVLGAVTDLALAVALRALCPWLKDNH